MSVKERLKSYIVYKDISVRSFESVCGLSFGYVNNIRVSIQPDKVMSISRNFPDLNTGWLLTGEGEMIKNAEQSQIKSSIQSNLPARGVPYFDDMECTGTILSMYTDVKEQPAFYIDYAHFNDCTAYVPVVGDSMYPNYCSGEIVAVKQINNLDVIQWGESYLVVTNDNANNLRTIKQIHYCEDESKIILRASNPNYRGDTVIPKEDIVSLFIIKGKIKRNQL